MSAVSGKPFLVALNLTRRCNLACAHCYLDAGIRAAGDTNELDTSEVKRVLDEISGVNPACMVVLTGGEPLLRPDIFEICRHAAGLGLMAVVGTNGTLLGERNVRQLIGAGVSGAGISVDSLNPAVHDGFRGLAGAWRHTMEGIEHCRRLGLAFQVHTSVHQDNIGEIEEIMAWAHGAGALVANFFFLVCTGRGERMTDISPAQYEHVLGQLIAAQERYPDMMVRARCAPHFKRLAYQQDTSSRLTLAQGYEGGGCLAGTRYCRVTPDGQVTACPYIGAPVASLRDQSFAGIWDTAPMFRQLREPQLSGKCGACEFAMLCGGCRARPFAAKGELMGEDWLCSYEPEGGAVIRPLEVEEMQPLSWDREASDRLQNLPYFLRNMIRNKVEQRARERQVDRVTLELMDALRKERFGDGAPHFPAAGKQGRKPIVWTGEAEARLAAMPEMLHGMLRKIVEEIAAEGGHLEVNCKLLDAVEALGASRPETAGPGMPWHEDAERMLGERLAGTHEPAAQFMRDLLRADAEDMARQMGEEIVSGAALARLLEARPAPVPWTQDARARLDEAPDFIRSGIKKAAERRARREGLAEITSADLTRFRNEAMMKAVRRMRALGFTELTFDGVFEAAAGRIKRLQGNAQAAARFAEIRGHVEGREGGIGLLDRDMVQRMREYLKGGEK